MILSSHWHNCVPELNPFCRAACSLKLKKEESAIEDCSAVLEKDEKNVKALFRRGQANAALKVRVYL